MCLIRRAFYATVWAVAIAGPSLYCQGPTVHSPSNQVPLSSKDQAATPSAPITNSPSSSFEVASVRLSPSGYSGYTSFGPSGTQRFTAQYVTLKLLAGMAFGIPQNQILGGPSWFDSQHYDIDAKAGDDTELTAQEKQLLLRQLLQDRFHLAVHHKSRDVSGYVLVVAKKAPTLQTSTVSGQGYILPGELQFPDLSLASLASMLGHVIGRPVVDKTGIAGKYKVELKYAPSDDSDSALPSIFTALQEQLGLKLVPQKVSVEALVIDHADRMPTEN